MKAISIIGLGNVGSILASHILVNVRSIDNLYIYDINTSKMFANYLDLMDMKDILGIPTTINLGIPKKNAIYIITAGRPRKSSEDDYNFNHNYKIVKQIVEKIGKDELIYIITNPTDRITKMLKKDGYNVKSIGVVLDNSRYSRFGNSDVIAGIIIDWKGYTAFGVVADVLKNLSEDLK